MKTFSMQFIVIKTVADSVAAKVYSIVNEHVTLFRMNSVFYLASVS